MSKYIIGIDQSTQGTKALLVDEGGHLIHRADRSHRQIVNEAGWVSHDPAEIAANVLAVARTVVEETGVDPADIAGVGISNQRETTVAWSRTTQAPFCLCALRMVSNHSEGTFERLRYSFGGDRPSQTPRQTLSPSRVTAAG